MVWVVVWKYPEGFQETNVLGNSLSPWNVSFCKHLTLFYNVCLLSKFCRSPFGPLITSDTLHLILLLHGILFVLSSRPILSGVFNLLKEGWIGMELLEWITNYRYNLKFKRLYSLTQRRPIHVKQSKGVNSVQGEKEIVLRNREKMVYICTKTYYNSK